MAVETDADRLIFLEDWDEVTLVYDSNRKVQGILDRQYVEAQGTAGYKPIVTCRTSDVSNASEDDSISISSVTFKIRGIISVDFQMLGPDFTSFILEKQ